MLGRVLLLAAALAATLAGPIADAEAAPRFVGRHIDLELQAAELDEVLELFAGLGRVNIVKRGDVHAGPITARLRRVRWDEALYRILRSQKLQMRVDGNVIYVLPEG